MSRVHVSMSSLSEGRLCLVGFQGSMIGPSGCQGFMVLTSRVSMLRFLNVMVVKVHFIYGLMSWVSRICVLKAMEIKGS